MSDDNKKQAQYDLISGEVHWRFGEVDKVVAKYDSDKQEVTFENIGMVRHYKAGVELYLSQHELAVRSFKRADIAADPIVKNIPPRPKKDRMKGDLTNEIVEWYRKYKPNEFATRYGLIRERFTGTATRMVPMYRPKPNSSLMEFIGERPQQFDVVDAPITLRATHLSYTPQECGMDDEDVEMEGGES